MLHYSIHYILLPYITQAEPYLTRSQLEWLMMLTDKDSRESLGHHRKGTPGKGMAYEVFNVG